MEKLLCFKKLFIIFLTGMALTGLSPLAQASHVLQSRHFTTADGLASNTVRKIIQDSDGYLWFCTNNGISCYDGYDFRNYGAEAGLTDPIIRSVYEDEKHRLIVQTVRGNVYCFDRKRGHTVRNDNLTGMSDSLQQLAMRNPATFDPKATKIRDEKGGLWRIGNNGELLYTTANGAKHILPGVINERIAMSRSYIFRVCHLRNGRIAVTTNGNGFFLYDPQIRSLEHFVSENGNPSSPIMSDNILCIAEDNKGNIWLGYEMLGVGQLNMEPMPDFSYLVPQEKDNEGMSGTNTIRAVHYDPYTNQLLIANRHRMVYTSEEGRAPLKPLMQMTDPVYCIQNGPDHSLWMGTRGSGLWHDGKYLRFDHSDSTSISSNDIYCLLFNKNAAGQDVLWVGTFGGGLSKAVLPADPKTPLKFEHFFCTDYGSRRVRALVQDTNGWMWAATSYGVYIFNPETLDQEGTDVIHLTAESRQLLSNEVRNIYLSSRGDVYFSELGKGFATVAVPDSIDGYSHLKLSHYSIGQGLCNDMVQSFMEDPDSCIWMATEMGISCFDPSIMSMTQNYLPSHTMAGNIFNEGEAAALPDGRIVFGGSWGAVIIDSEELKDRQMQAPTLYRISQNIEGQNMHLILTTFDFGIRPNSIRYSYQLNDNPWTPPSNINHFILVQQRPGHYKLLARAVNEAGVWSEPLDASFDIAWPWYLRWWAISLWVFLVLLIFVAIHAWTRARIKLRQHLRMEAELNEAKLNFFTNVSHEFRTPLTLIRGGLERIRESGLLPDQLKQPMSLVDRNSDRLMHLVNQLLEFRRMENQVMSLRLEQMDIMDFIRQLFSSFSDIVQQKKLHYELECQPDSLQGFFDRSCIDKVLYNLLSNSIKYTPEGGYIRLTVRALPDPTNQLEICITDSGIGIPEDQRKHLFERYNRSKYLSGSMGIGLSLCAALVEIHHGDILYEPNPEGGSIFKVILPLTQENYSEEDYLKTDVVLKEEHSYAPLPELDTPANAQQILVIEDNDDLREYVVHELSHYFKVQSASNGEEGLKMVETDETGYDLVVTDIMMPGISGMEVIRQLRENFNTSHIPIVALTALDSTTSKIEGLTAGVDAYLTKPFSTRLLLATLINLMNQRNRLRERFSSENAIHTVPLITTRQDREFIDRLDAIIDKEMSNSDFSADDFASQMNLGRTIFFRKVKGVTGYTPKEYLRIRRLKRAAILLQTTDMSVSAVAFEVGINDPLYFSRCFKQQFGAAPSDYVRKQPKDQ
jgi:signal transduction histidine kinase/DNA-binding response OmpR family regulator/ligand-binding sensor domain-containing protein